MRSVEMWQVALAACVVGAGGADVDCAGTACDTGSSGPSDETESAELSWIEVVGTKELMEGIGVAGTWCVDSVVMVILSRKRSLYVAYGDSAGVSEGCRRVTGAGVPESNGDYCPDHVDLVNGWASYGKVGGAGHRMNFEAGDWTLETGSWRWIQQGHWLLRDSEKTLYRSPGVSEEPPLNGWELFPSHGTSPAPTLFAIPKDQVTAYVKLARGASGCAAGEEVASVAECETAVESLGFPVTPKWVSAYPGLPRHCSLRDDDSGAGERLHYNSAGSGQGRKDLSPVCKRQELVPNFRVPVRRLLAEEEGFVDRIGSFTRRFTYLYDPAVGRSDAFVRELTQLGFDFTAHSFRIGLETQHGSGTNATTAFRVPNSWLSELESAPLEELVDGPLKALCEGGAERYWPPTVPEDAFANFSLRV